METAAGSGKPREQPESWWFHGFYGNADIRLADGCFSHLPAQRVNFCCKNVCCPLVWASRSHWGARFGAGVPLQFPEPQLGLHQQGGGLGLRFRVRLMLLTWDLSWAPAGPAWDKKAPAAPQREGTQLELPQRKPTKLWGGAAQLGKLQAVPGAELICPGVHMELMGGPKSGLIFVQRWEITREAHTEPHCGLAHPSLCASATPALSQGQSQPSFQSLLLWAVYMAFSSEQHNLNIQEGCDNTNIT